MTAVNMTEVNRQISTLRVAAQAQSREPRSWTNFEHKEIDKHIPLATLPSTKARRNAGPPWGVPLELIFPEKNP